MKHLLSFTVHIIRTYIASQVPNGVLHIWTWSSAHSQVVGKWSYPCIVRHHLVCVGLYWWPHHIYISLYWLFLFCYFANYECDAPDLIGWWLSVCCVCMMNLTLHIYWVDLNFINNYHGFGSYTVQRTEKERGSTSLTLAWGSTKVQPWCVI